MTRSADGEFEFGESSTRTVAPRRIGPNEFTTAYQNLYAKAGEPPYKQIIDLAGSRTPAIKISKSQLSECRSGSWIPQTEQVAKFLIRYLAELARIRITRAAWEQWEILREGSIAARRDLRAQSKRAALPEQLLPKSLRDQGLRVWTSDLFKAGMETVEVVGDLPPLRQDETVDAVLLAEGRLPNLQLAFTGVARAFDEWIGTRRKRRNDGLRVFWIVGPPGPYRGKALLAAASRAGRVGRTVYDAGRNLELAAAAVAELDHLGPVLVLVDLPAHQPDLGWQHLLQALGGLRRREDASEAPEVALVIGGIESMEQQAHGILQSSLEITPVDTGGRPQQRPYSHTGGQTMASRSLSAEQIYNRGLPATAVTIYGREPELAMLREAWLSDRTQVITVVAAGGVGKSSLVNSWLQDMRDRDYLGADKVLAWSFYSQGTKEDLVSADAFVSAALDWLGDKESATMSPPMRGARLAELIREHRFLLILDGLEPLQYPPTAPDVGGMLTDSAVAALLRGLSQPGFTGLCVITTRVPVTDLARVRPGTQTVVLTLDNLEVDAGAELLQSLIGPQSDRAQLEDAVREVHGHALAVSLLGRYLREVHAGQLGGRFELRELTVAVADGGHARRIMETYALWLDRGGRRTDLAMLELVGLFDRPAPYAAMTAVLTSTPLGESAPGLIDAGGAEWLVCVERLREMGLLARETAGMPDTLDAHPLVREHFRDRVRSSREDLWQAGNRALYDFYRQAAPDLPDTADGMNMLYAAVNHGCTIGLHQEVYDSVLVPRVWRGPRASFSTRQLGMTGSEIVALSNYFLPGQWVRLRGSVPLSTQAQMRVMANAALRLRQLGRPDDARNSCSAVFDAVTPSASAPSEMADVAYIGGLLCELMVIDGRLRDSAPGALDGARSVATTAIEYGDRCDDPYFPMYARTCLAEVDFMDGDLGRAEDMFDEAATLAAERNASPPFLYNQVLYRYGYLMIETGRAINLCRAAEGDPGWGLNGTDSSQLSGAIRDLMHAAAQRSLIEQGELSATRLDAVIGQVDRAMIEFRSIGYSDYVVRGLLERVHVLRTRRSPEDYAAALDDLDEVGTEVARGGMALLAADLHLHRAACHLAWWPSMTPRQQDEVAAPLTESLRQAAQRVRELGYGRRRPMLTELERQARTLLIPRQTLDRRLPGE